MPLAQGQGSGDFREISGRVHLLHMGVRNSWGQLATDAFTQVNPPIITASANRSTLLANVTTVGVLSGSVAFTRPDAGNGLHGGPVQVGAAYIDRMRPLGVFLNDAVGNPYENQPARGSERGPFVNGMATIGVALWETQRQIGGSAALTYAMGDHLYASVNGLLTNRMEDAYEYQVVADPDNVTLIGIVRVAPDANNDLMVLNMRI